MRMCARVSARVTPAPARVVARSRTRTRALARTRQPAFARLRALYHWLSAMASRAAATRSHVLGTKALRVAVVLVHSATAARVRTRGTLSVPWMGTFRVLDSWTSIRHGQCVTEICPNFEHEKLSRFEHAN